MIAAFYSVFSPKVKGRPINKEGVFSRPEAVLFKKQDVELFFD